MRQNNEKLQTATNMFCSCHTRQNVAKLFRTHNNDKANQQQSNNTPALEEEIGLRSETCELSRLNVFCPPGNRTVGAIKRFVCIFMFEGKQLQTYTFPLVAFVDRPTLAKTHQLDMVSPIRCQYNNVQEVSHFEHCRAIVTLVQFVTGSRPQASLTLLQVVTGSLCFDCGTT